VRMLHNVRDRGATSHNFAFDTTQAVYHAAVHARTPPHEGNAPVVQPAVGDPKRRRSGIQRECLALYKHMLVAARQLEDEASRRELRRHIQSEFRKHAEVPRREILRIEWLWHSGRNRLEELRTMKPSTRFNTSQ